MIEKLLIANRGEIAVRVIRTARRMGIASVAVFSTADSDALHAKLADEAVLIGPAAAADSYLQIPAIIEAARRTGCQAIHPGYGFLSENAEFAEACEEAGLIFVGPSAESIRVMGSKAEARRLMSSHGVPVVPGYEGEAQDLTTLRNEAKRIGYPVLVKASAGGGGKGMRVVRSEDHLDAAIETAQREANQAFGDGRLLLERYIDSPRHIEFQIFGDAHGALIHLFERECSVQRRHQKIIEEAPAPNLPTTTRAAMADAALSAGRALGYQSAGTVEFIVAPSGEFFFLEVNTRLQVEHPVTEAITGLDLVDWQLRVAQGSHLPLTQEQVTVNGSAIECRVYAEDPNEGFLPVTGSVLAWQVPSTAHIRVDSGIAPGDEVTIHYDPMLAKIICWGETREDACRALSNTLSQTACLGLTTNIDLLRATIAHPRWRAGQVDTHFVADHLEELCPALSDEQIGHAALIASAVFASRRAGATFPSLPGLTPGWRNNRWRDQELNWVFDADRAAEEVRFRVSHEALTLTQRGESHRAKIRRLHDTEFQLTLDGHRKRVRVASSGQQFFVDSGERHICLSLQERLPLSTDTGRQGAHTAPMPGKVIRIAVTVGQEVVEGQPLVIMEAMKMEHTLESQCAGEVTEILVNEGQQVDRDAELVTIEVVEA